MNKWRLIARDGSIVVLTIIAAFLLNKYGVLDLIVSTTGNYYPLGAFFTGLFFTSVFTTAPAIAVLASLGSSHPPLVIAFFGGIGALCGDIIMFRFMKKDVTADLDFILSKTKSKRLKHIIHLKAFRWFLTSLGAIVIASPLPDEIGLALMGVSRISLAFFIPISFIFNFIGIYVIALFPHLL